MTQLETLIQTLCPNGVHWSSVNDLIKQKIVHTVSASIKLKRNEAERIILVHRYFLYFLVDSSGSISTIRINL